MGILILEIGLGILLNNLLKNKSNKKIRYAICIALLLNCWNMRTYKAMWKPCGLYIHYSVYLYYQHYSKKENQSSAYFFQPSCPHPSLLLVLWICIPSIKPPTTSQPQKKSQTPNFYLLGKDFAYESTSKDDMEILFKQLKRLTKVAPVYFVYGNHVNKTKFTKNKLNH